MEDSESTKHTAFLPANAPTLAHDMNMPINTMRLSRTATMDRTVLGISILLVIFAALMIAN
jgi:hypothetical protein